jgi:hypothetical protein
VIFHHERTAGITSAAPRFMTAIQDTGCGHQSRVGALVEGKQASVRADRISYLDDAWIGHSWMRPHPAASDRLRALRQLLL